MYGLPVNFDVSIFVGRTVELVSFAYAQIDLNFDDGTILSIQSAYLHDHGQSNPALIAVPPAGSTLMQLVEQVVESVAVDDRGTLTLRFTNGQTLSCFDNSPDYESYIIQHRAGDIVV